VLQESAEKCEECIFLSFKGESHFFLFFQKKVLKIQFLKLFFLFAVDAVAE